MLGVMREIFFWLYQALPGLTGPDSEDRLQGLQDCIVTWLHGKRVNWVVGLIELIGFIGVNSPVFFMLAESLQVDRPILARATC